jgi:hypothetical protein
MFVDSSLDTHVSSVCSLLSSQVVWRHSVISFKHVSLLVFDF